MAHSQLNPQMRHRGYGGLTVNYTWIFDCAKPSTPNSLLVQGSAVLLRLL